MALERIRVVFIDDGGVLNDNQARAPQWRRLLGEYLAPRLGGTPEEWARANAGAFDRGWQRLIAQNDRAGQSGGVDAWVRADRGLWLADMCEQVGVPVPSEPSAYAIEAGTWVSERVRAEIPGASRAVHTLADRGHVLHTASGGLSWELEPYLRGMGIRHRFDRLYGPDLVDRWKNGPHYYRALLAHSGTEADAAVVVDDGPEQRLWATSTGMAAYPSLEALLAAIG